MMYSTFTADVRPFDLKAVLKHTAQQYDEHLDKMGNAHDLIPACALEDKGTTYLIGLPDPLVQAVFCDFFKEKKLQHEVIANRISINKDNLTARNLTSADQGYLLFMLNKKLKQEQACLSTASPKFKNQ